MYEENYHVYGARIGMLARIRDSWAAVISSAGTPLRVSHPSTRVRQGIHVVLIAPFQHAASSSDP